MEKATQGSETEKNLMKAFAGESQARNRYTFFASIAQKEGYEQIAEIFLETARNEKEHAKLYYQHIENGPVEVNMAYPKFEGTTVDNLVSAMNGEYEEWSYLYPHFGDIAEQEGFKQIAMTFRNVTEAEKYHEARYKKLHQNMLENQVFSRPEAVNWKCINCGRIINGKNAPELCPTCHHPKAFFKLRCDNW